MTSPFLYFPGHRLSTAELSAACLDGHLVGLGEGYVPADTIETSWLRAASLRELLGVRLAAIADTAAWIHGARAEPPSRHRVQRATAHRLHEPIGRRFVYRDSRIPEQDLMHIAGVAVTTPARTVADLARSATAADLILLRAFADADPRTIDDGRRLLRESARLPHKRAAAQVLEELLRTM